MGWNSSLIILHDQLSRLEQPDAGKRIMRAIEGWSSYQWALRQNPENRSARLEVDFGFGSVTSQHHADDTSLVAFHANQGEKVFGTFGLSGRTEDEQVQLLRQWADSLGYDIHKKPSPRNSSGLSRRGF